MSFSQKPTGITKLHLMYLDSLRESGAVNMFGAAPYLIARFPHLTRQQARAILRYWMKTFEEPA
jgi:hypothetical protein